MTAVMFHLTDPILVYPDMNRHAHIRPGAPGLTRPLGVAAQTVKVCQKQLYGRCRIRSQAELFTLLLLLLVDGS
jgi:hypothetical protein